MSDLSVVNGERAEVGIIAKGLLDCELEEIKSFEWFEDSYLKARVSRVRGKITAVWNNWFFITHRKGTGIYRQEEFKILPEEV